MHEAFITEIKPWAKLLELSDTELYDGLLKMIAL
jgi:hypothetical protein